MKKFLIGGILGMISACRLMAATQPLYENYGTVTNTPQVDATAFANYGNFFVSSPNLYHTVNTLRYTNTDLLQGSLGFQFEFIPTKDGQTNHAASDFVNAGRANGSLVPTVDASSIISIWSTNVLNKGLLT